MKLSRTMKLFSVVAIFALPFTFSASSFAAQRQSCTGVCVDGGYTGGGTGQVPGGSGGRGPFSGRTGVMFGYQPQADYAPCTDPDRSLMSKLQYPAGTGGPYYEHYLAAYSRDGSKTLLAGGPGSLYWDTAWNSDTGQPTSANVTDPDGAAGPNGNLFPVNWQLTRRYCIPLKGGGNLEKILEVAKPKLILNGKTNEYMDTNNVIPKVAIRMKKAEIKVRVDEGALATAGINLTITAIDRLQFLVCDLDARDKWEAENPGGEIWLRYCYLGDDKNSPIYFYSKNATWNQIDADTKEVTIKVKYKKKGRFAIAGGADYITGSTVTGSTNFRNQTAFSEPALNLNVISVRSVNRR